MDLTRLRFSGQPAESTATPFGLVRGSIQLEAAVGFPPVHDRLLVVRIEAIGDAAGAHFLDKSTSPTQQIGTVVAVTREQPLDDGYLSPLDIACGDHILYGRYAGREIRLERERYLILREDEVCGI